MWNVNFYPFLHLNAAKVWDMTGFCLNMLPKLTLAVWFEKIDKNVKCQSSFHLL